MAFMVRIWVVSLHSDRWSAVHKKGDIVDSTSLLVVQHIPQIHDSISINGFLQPLEAEMLYRDNHPNRDV